VVLTAKAFLDQRIPKARDAELSSGRRCRTLFVVVCFTHGPALLRAIKRYRQAGVMWTHLRRMMRFVRAGFSRRDILKTSGVLVVTIRCGVS
jgi:hypothetical protein